MTSSDSILFGLQEAYFYVKSHQTSFKEPLEVFWMCQNWNWLWYAKRNTVLYLFSVGVIYVTFGDIETINYRKHISTSSLIRWTSRGLRGVLWMCKNWNRLICQEDILPWCRQSHDWAIWTIVEVAGHVPFEHTHPLQVHYRLLGRHHPFTCSPHCSSTSHNLCLFLVSPLNFLSMPLLHSEIV